MGRLIDIIGAVGTCYLGVARNARVIDAVAQSRWNIRGQRSRHFHALYESIQNIQVPQEDQGRDKTRDHVFFACPYTYSVWDRLAGSLCGRRINPDWSLTLQFVTNNNLQLMDKILLKMVFQTCVYCMWKESNERRHQRGFRTVDQAIRIVDKAIRNRISSLRYGPVHRFAGLLQHWLEVFDRT
ncbi:hypothetical protein IGI04_004837 [Brassica rapa subsp. trilocularis]|uniref:Reverse transcriptase zinc-binding domain-containing protein n=1 Tax=Brassica rapa subsp. trilocularis TaxID=1813537 RepID=A0ABQ7NCB2_BRACM|nr:hypothetical protein IGI04_004837 [Brassica rapa subsp. trilocularis]